MNSFLKNKNVLVTGGTGFLGGWLIKKLIQLKAKVTVIIRDYEPRSMLFLEKLNEKVHIVYGDLTDYNIVERALNEEEIEIVFHLAAQTQVTISNHSPISTFESNIKGTWIILEAIRLYRKIIISGINLRAKR